MNRSFVTYKGQFVKLLQFQLYYGIIKIKKLKKLVFSLKYNKNKYNTFCMVFDFRIFIILYKLHIINKLITSFLYIKKKGILINLISTYNPIQIIRPYSIISINNKLRKRFL